MVALVGARPQGQWCLLESLTRKVLRSKRSQCLEMLQNKHISLIAQSNREDALKKVISKAAAEAYLPHAPAPVERHEANGRAEPKVRHLREQLQILIEGARARDTVFVRLPVAQSDTPSRRRLTWSSQMLKSRAEV